MKLFFNKKYFLSDLFTDFVDIHCHLLPGIDDGASSTEVSETMLNLYESMGFKKIIATPHIMESFYNNNAKKIASQFDDFNLNRKNQTIALNFAAEYMIDSAFVSLLENNELLTLKNRYILVEMSYFQKPHQLDTILFDLRQKNYLPILAHPERYSYLNFESIQELKLRGCFLQLNLLSLSNHYGPQAKKLAHQLLINDCIDFVATDAHKPEHLEKIKNMIIQKSSIQPLKKAIETTKNQFMP